MRAIAPLPHATGLVLVIAPHMDDESLGCGMLLAGHPQRDALRVLFATDGSHSPEHARGASAAERRELAATREREAGAALRVLGLAADQYRCLGFEDGTLARQPQALAGELREPLRAATQVFVPFRFDRHPDHLAVGRAVAAIRDEGGTAATVLEYFVYSQWRLLPGGDVRDCVDPGQLRQTVPTAALQARKRRALDCYRSQTTRYLGWQNRPVLTPELLDRACAGPEVYLLQDPARPGRRVLARGRAWVPVAHRVEPVLKRWKDRLSGWRGR
ncbi:MAG: PIG-L family deacetylase [Gammaproteobacteria bacterium]|nr:MAG: PIG-L family deacetylase [Gammaproteobacteria bacterium]